MPLRERLSAPLLGALAVTAGLAGGWLALAIAALGQGGAGALAGFPWHGVRLLPSWIPQAAVALDGSHGAGAWAILLVAGPVVAALAGLGLHAVAQILAAPTILRAVAFQIFSIAWLRVPLLILAAGLPGGEGPVASLYARLGEPETGRWAAIALAALALWGAAGVVARRCVAFGREWLRDDSRRFRRRIVLVFSGYPFAAALGVAAIEGAAGPFLVAGVGAALVLVALWLRAP